MRRSTYTLTTLLFAIALLLPLGLEARQQGAPDNRINRPEFTDISGLTDAVATTDSDLPGATAAWDRASTSAGRINVVIELSEPSVITTFTQARQRGDLAQANAVGQQQLARIERSQQRMLTTLSRVDSSLKMIYRVQRVYNGIAAEVDSASLAQIARLPGVRAIHPLVLKELLHTSSVPLIGAPEVWNSGGLGATGANIKIGIIDSGIDYIHTNFGGPGPAAYAANNTTVITDTFNGQPLFPNARVVGGYDFVGDAYNAGNPATSTPAPDPDPMDCNGHGTHVAGTAAGAGVNADGSTYTGPYSSTLNFDAFRIGPGVAPQADLYALRVFGCSGSTAVTDKAIEWATDPNGDGDFSDRLDVINMSLGSTFGSPYDTSAVASDRAAELGVIVVTSAGNSSDTNYITGSPGVAGRAISTASSVDELDVVDAFAVIGGPLNGTHPATFSSNFNWAASNPLTATLSYTSTFNGCSAATAAQRAVISGTVVLVDWAPPGSSNFFCGSLGRANNAFNAGAVGIIMASGQTFFDTAIAGNATIRALFTTFTVGQALKSELAGGPVTVRLSNEYRNTVKFLTPGTNDTLSNFTSRGPRRGDSFLKPDITAPGQSIFSAATGTGNQGRSLNGTSMAAPHVAGMMALLRQIHPSWTVEELKALAMNTATNDLFTGANLTGNRFGPGRIGAGRIDAPDAATSQVIAYNAADAGLVSVSFGFVEVLPGAPTTASKPIRVVNKGNTAATYAVGYEPRVTMAGVSYSLSASSVTIPAGGSAIVTVTMTADPALMKRDGRDVTMATMQSGFPRHWLGEAAGYVTLSNAPLAVTQSNLRVPVHSAPRLASAMRVEQNRLRFTGGVTGTAAISLTGQHVATAPLSATGTLGEDFSIVTAFELQGVSPQLTFPSTTPPTVASADIRYVGIMSDIEAAGTITNTDVYFGIASWGDWTVGSASDTEFDIYIDTDNSGITVTNTGNIVGAEYVLFNWNEGSRTGTGANDAFVSVLVRLSNNTTSAGFTNIVDANSNTNPFNNNVMVLSVPAAKLGLTPAQTRINYKVISFQREFQGVVDETRVFSYDVARPGLSLPDVAYLDVPGALEFGYDLAAFRAARSRGLLLLHHHNAQGKRAEAVRVLPNLRARLARPESIVAGIPVTFTATVSNTGNGATDALLSVKLPGGASFIGVGAGMLNAGEFCSLIPDQNAIACDLGTLGSNESVDVSFQVVFNQSSAVSGPIQVGAVSADAPDDEDPTDNGEDVTPNVEYRLLVPITRR